MEIILLMIIYPILLLNFFDKKVVSIVESTRLEPGVYNGHCKIGAEDWVFKTGERIIECIKSLKIKNTEAYDRIPQRINI